MSTQNIFAMTDAWNSIGTTFDAIGMNVTDTASAAGSRLLNLQVGGSSRVQIGKAGNITTTVAAANTSAVTTTGYSLTGSSTQSLFDLAGTWNTTGLPTAIKLTITDTASATDSLFLDFIAGSNSRFAVRKSGTVISSGEWYGPNAGVTGSLFSFGASSDLLLRRDAAASLAQRNGANAQAFRVYGTFTDASNYRRVEIAMTTGGAATIAPQGAGTGASGNVLHISGLPTSNPGAGILWNDGGTVKVGT